MTEGNYVPYEQTFASRLDQSLPEFQILNLGVSGYAPDQYLINARRHLPRYDVDRIAVVYYPANDTVDVLRDRYLEYAKPVFGTSPDAPINTPLSRLDGDEGRWRLRDLVSESAIYAMFRPFYKRFIAPPLEYEASREHLAYSGEGMKKSLELMATIASENPGVPFRISYVPRREEIHERDLHERNVALFQRECASRGVECIVPPFLSDSEDPDIFYLVGDGHLNAQGAGERAKVILSAFHDGGQPRPRVTCIRSPSRAVWLARRRSVSSILGVGAASQELPSFHSCSSAASGGSAHVALREKGPANLSDGFPARSQGLTRPGPR